MLTTRKKQNIIKDVQNHEEDTGSAQVQIGLLTRRISELVNHLKKHKKDESSRRGILKMVSKRRNLLNFIKREDDGAYKEIVDKLGLKR